MDTTYQNSPPAYDPNQGAVMSWLDHARELRDRLLKASMAVVLGAIVGFAVVNWNNQAVIFDLVDRFAPNGVQVVAVTEVFTNAIRLALGIGIALAMPVIVYQLLAFVVPALTRTERRIIAVVLPFVTLCFVAGLAFGWFVTIPAAFEWLLSYGPSNIDKTPTLAHFLSLFTRLMLLNGILFELPVIVYSLVWLGVVQRQTLTRYRRYSILIIVILSAIVTPTSDPVNLAFTAIPMYLLYELGLLLALVAPRRRTPAPIP